ncbi:MULTISPECIES: hypothetical protein, partial [Agrobacterium]|uniref:hypothetical protein n=1 Tax=Agrobacterium TaxID=357 RepID=UPI00195C9F8D
RSSITEVSLHGINTSRKAKSVTHVSGTKRHLSLKSDNKHLPLKISPKSVKQPSHMFRTV